MDKNFSKTIKQVLIAALIFLSLYFGFKQFNKPKVVVGDKEITIIILDKEDNKVFDEKINTDAELLGDLIDEINNDKEIFKLAGSKSDEFGRFVESITLVEMADGEFWVYDSSNNTVCKAEGFCPGIDLLAIENNNDFTFNILVP